MLLQTGLKYLPREFKLLPRLEEAWGLGAQGSAVTEGGEVSATTSEISTYASSSSSPPSQHQNHTRREASITIQTAYNPEHAQNKQAPTFSTEHIARDAWTQQERTAAERSAKPQTMEELKDSVSYKVNLLLISNKLSSSQNYTMQTGSNTLSPMLPYPALFLTGKRISLFRPKVSLSILGKL